MKNKRGISLIVLVITIIIIIILAGAVILNLADNNPIENAEKAKIMSDLDTFRSEFTLSLGKKYADANGMFDVSKIKNEDIEEYIPSIKGKEVDGVPYTDILTITGGEIGIKENEKLPEATKEMIKEGLGQTEYIPEEEKPVIPENPTKETYQITYNLDGGIVSNPTSYSKEDEITLTNPTRDGYIFAGWTGSNGTTAQTIVTIAKGSTGDKTYTANWDKIITKQILENEASTYIGKQVTYNVDKTKFGNQDIDWRIFGLDENGNIMLKANDYVDLSYKTSKYPEGISQGNGTYNIKANSREKLISYLETSSNWSEYAVEGKTTARGAMTLPEFIEGYNRVNDEDLHIEELTEGNLTTADGTFTGKVPGYAIKKGTGSYDYYVDGITEEYNGMNFYIAERSNAYFMWLASASAYASSDVMFVSFDGIVNYCTYYARDLGGVSPVVSLTSAILVENENGELVVE